MNSKIVISAVDNTDPAFKSATNNLKVMDSQVRKVIGSVVALAGAGGFAMLAKSQLEAVQGAQAYSSALGIVLGDMQSWQSAARSVNIENDKMADIFKDMSEKIGDAFNGNGEAAEVLKKLNLQVADLVALSPDQQLLKIAGSLDEVGSRAEKIQILESLASDASLLLPLLENNAQKFVELRDEAQAYGGALNQVDAAKMQAANAEIVRAEEAVTGLTRRITAELSPIIERMAIGFQRATKFAADFFNIESDQERINELFAERLVLQERLEKSKSGQASRQNSAIRKEIADITDEMNEIINLQMVEAQRASEKRKQDAEATAAAHERFKLKQQEVLLEQQLKDQQSVNKKLESGLTGLRQSLMTEEEAIQESFFNRGLLLEESLESRLLTETEYADLRLQLNQQTEEKITEIHKKEKEKQLAEEEKLNQLKSDALVGTLSNLATLMNSHSKKLFNIGKTAAIAEALVNTYNAVTKTMSATPYPWNIPLAAAQAAAGAVQVQNIRSQSFGGGGSVGGVPSAGVGAATGQPVGPQPVPSLDSANQSSGGSTIIHIYNPELLSDQSIDNLATSLAGRIERNDIILISPTSRNGQELAA